MHDCADRLTINIIDTGVNPYVTKPPYHLFTATSRYYPNNGNYKIYPLYDHFISANFDI